MSNPIIMLDYSFTERDGLKALADVGIRDILLEDYLWQTWEPVRDKRDWGPMDRWVTDCAAFGITPIIRFRGVPDWAPDDWKLRDADGNLAPADACSENFSPWCKEGQSCVMERLQLIYERYKSLPVTVNPPQPRSEMWLYPGNSADQTTRETIFCHDRQALDSFHAWRERHGRLSIDPLRARGLEALEDADVWTDMLLWINESLHHYWEDLYGWCADALEQRDLFGGFCPQENTSIDDAWHIQIGYRDQEAWIEILRIKLAMHRCTFNPIVYAYFYWVEPERGGWANAAYLLYQTRRFGWKLRVGAEGAANIVENSMRAITLGFAGLVVGSPFTYGAEDSIAGVKNIGEAVKLWQG